MLVSAQQGISFQKSFQRRRRLPPFQLLWIKLGSKQTHGEKNCTLLYSHSASTWKQRIQTPERSGQKCPLWIRCGWSLALFRPTVSWPHNFCRRLRSLQFRCSWLLSPHTSLLNTENIGVLHSLTSRMAINLCSRGLHGALWTPSCQGSRKRHRWQQNVSRHCVVTQTHSRL